MKPILKIMVLLTVALSVTGSVAWGVENSGKLTHAQLKSLIASAKTPADHTKLANYYRYQVNLLKAEEKDHEDMAAAYDKNPMGHPVPKAQTLGEHCRNLVKVDEESIKEANEMATMHDEMAKGPR